MLGDTLVSSTMRNLHHSFSLPLSLPPLFFLFDWDRRRYGPTEVTIGMTACPRVPANGKPSNIGPQFANVGTYVLVPGTDRPVPRGAIGELCASGKLVGRGYLNRPELTEKGFPALTARYNHNRIYRTGDLVRVLHDGSFEFAGRADDQVKLRGQRLEISEINHVVKKAGGLTVQAVATLVLRHPKQQKDQLVSFLVVLSDPREQQPPPNTTSAATAGKPTVIFKHSRQLVLKLVAACWSKLPAYMVPTHFLPISHMPLSINNKVDARALKALYQDTTLDMLQQLARREEEDTAATATTGDWTEAEKLLRSVLMDMTKLDSSEISRSSTIFELGLDSVSVVGLSRRLRRSGFAAAVAATPSLVMQNPQLSQLASALLAATTAAAQSVVVAGTGEAARLEATRREIAAFASRNTLLIAQTLRLQTATTVEDGEIERIMPCTALQEGMIVRFLDSHSESSSPPLPPLYFNAFLMVLHPSTDERKLRSAWDTVVGSTDVLRTCFCETPDGYAQVVLNKTRAPILWEEVDIATEIGDEEGYLQTEVGRALARAAARNQDLHSPPLSLVLLRAPAKKRVLSLNIFHALYDGNSLPLVLHDVRHAYAGDQYRPRPLQFADVTAHLLSCADLGLEAQAFWKANVKPSTVTMPLQFDQRHHSPAEVWKGDYAEELLLDIEGMTLGRLCRRLQCTPQAVFLAAWAPVLALHSSNNSSGDSGPVVTLGLVVSGRSLPIDNIEGVIGPTFNTIPASFVLGHSGAASSWETLVRAIHRFNSESLAFHHTPLRLIHKWLRRTSEQPLIESLFAYQKDPVTDGHGHDEELWEMMHPGSAVTVADVSYTL